MPHIHDEIDFTVVAFIVHRDQVLLIKHKALKIWLPVGGHIEPDEDPITALYREVAEECGLPITLLGTKPDVAMPHGACLVPPDFMDIHDISPTHRHIGMAYIARADSSQVVLAELEHDAIRWFTAQDLADPQYDLLPNIRHYAEQALQRCA